jgi:hypothetical protein
MQTITTIGLDIVKSVFQVHGVDAAGQVVIRRQLKRRYVLTFFQKLAPCLVGIEACASSHHWSRKASLKRTCWSTRSLQGRPAIGLETKQVSAINPQYLHFNQQGPQ